MECDDEKSLKHSNLVLENSWKVLRKLGNLANNFIIRQKRKKFRTANKTFLEITSEIDDFSYMRSIEDKKSVTYLDDYATGEVTQARFSSASSYAYLLKLYARINNGN